MCSLWVGESVEMKDRKEVLLGVDYGDGKDKTCECFGYVKRGIVHITRFKLK